MGQAGGGEDGSYSVIVDFATFCYAGDAHRLHKPGQLEKQVESNGYPFNKIFVIYQGFSNSNRPDKTFYHQSVNDIPIYIVWVDDIDKTLIDNGIDISKSQYVSDVDKAHTWKNHVVNHLVAAHYSQDLSKSDYIVFADNDCWMIKQPMSWVEVGIEVLKANPDAFIVSPNDGEPQRITQVISQQMFLARTDEFRQADFNQPGYSGNPRDYPEMPEYHAMGEGRIHYHCVASGKYRYVLPPEYRYFHHNRLNEDGTYKTNYSDYGL